MTKRRTYRVNADRWNVLVDILVGTPEDFNPDSATLRGRTVDSHHIYPGMLPGPIASDFRRYVRDGMIQYVIYSYATPIAWRYHTGKWAMPGTKYSVTTSKHQGRVGTAISQISGGGTV